AKGNWVWKPKCPVLDHVSKLTNHLGKFDGKVDEGFLVGYSISSKAFRVFNSRTRIIQEILHINVFEKQPNVLGSRPTWLFDIDTLTQSMNYQPVATGNQPNSSVDIQEILMQTIRVEAQIVELIQFPSLLYLHQDFLNIYTRIRKSLFVDPSQYPDDLNMPAFEDIIYSDDEEDVVVEADFSNLEISITGHTHEEGIDYEEDFAPVARIEAIRLFLTYASFIGFMVYQMDVKSDFLYDTIEEEGYICQPPGFEDLGYPDKVYKVVKALYGLHQAPRACQDKYVAKILRKFGLTDVKSARTPIDTEKPLIKDHDGFMVYQMDVKSAFLYDTIEEEEGYICQPPGFEDPGYPDKAVEDALKVEDDDNKGKIAELDAKKDVTLVAAEEDMNADVQERLAESQAKVYHLDLQHAEKVLGMQDNDEAEPAKVEEVIEVVTIAKLMTEVVITAATTITAAQVPKASAPRRRKGVVIQDPEETATSLVIVNTEDEAFARQLKAELNVNTNWDDVMEQVKRKEKQDNIVMRYQALKRKHVTEAQARKNMMIYIKNMARFKIDFFKAKKQRINKEEEELKAHLKIVVNDDDVFTEATPLASKVLVIDYQIHHENNKPYYKIIKADGTHKLFLSFITLLNNFDKEDLEMLWKLVQERFQSLEPKNFSYDFLLNTLKIIFKNPNVEANI
nr:retrovirus-related Pol polyprotein from transposon TNT 1-94 [Tanacetum cinerariifolium]